MTQEQLDALIQLHTRFLTGRIGGRRAMLQNTDLSGLSLQNQDMRQADFTGCSFKNSDLSGTNFKEAKLYACDLSNANLNNAIFVRADLRGARIESANLEGADLEKADLRVGGIASADRFSAPEPVNFRGANLAGAKLAGAVASKADFSDAIMTGANVSNADLSGAQFEGADMSNIEIVGTTFMGANLKNAIMTGVEIEKLQEMGVDLSQTLTDSNVGRSVSELAEPLVKLIETHRNWVKSAGQQGEQLDLSDMDIRHVGNLKMEKLTAIKAVNAKFFGLNLYKVELQSAVLDKSDFRNCDMEEADLRGSSFIGGNFSHATLKNVDCSPLLFGTEGGSKRFSPCNFEGAIMRYADLSGAKMKSAVLKNVDLSYANLRGADLRGADLSDAILKGAKLDDAQLEDAILPLGDKPVFRIPGAKAEDDD